MRDIPHNTVESSEQDSNLRGMTPADLQSAAFDLSAIRARAVVSGQLSEMLC
jgi:hypothetical protein